MAAMVVVNASTYVVRSRSHGECTYLRVGFPLTFWREGLTFSSFRPFHFCVDVAFAVWVSYRVGRWWDERGNSDYLLGTKP